MKYKIKRRNKTVKTWYIVFIFIVIIILMSTSYSLWQTKLYINGKIAAEIKSLPVEIPPQGTDENGIDRVTTNTSMDFIGTEIYRVVSEEHVENTITTTIQHVYKQWFGTSNIDTTISFNFQNTTDKDFTNGEINLIDYNDANNILYNLNYTISNATVSPGESAEVQISGRLRGNEDVADNTYYHFVITYYIENVKYYLYYNIIILPI